VLPGAACRSSVRGLGLVQAIRRVGAFRLLQGVLPLGLTRRPPVGVHGRPGQIGLFRCCASESLKGQEHEKGGWGLADYPSLR